MRKTFKHDPIDLGYKELDCETKESGRTYWTPEGKSYPSITTVIGKASDQSWLDDWKERVGTFEVERVVRHACRRGNALHDTAERYLKNVEDYHGNDTMPHHKFNFKNLQKILDADIGTVRLQEAPLYSDHLRVAGRVDLVAEFRGRLSVIDFKTAKHKKTAEDIPGYFKQKAGYAVMVEERSGIAITQLVTLMVVDNQKDPLVFINHRDDWIGALIDDIKKFENLYKN